MATSVYHNSPRVQSFSIAHLSYETWEEAGRYYLKALHTGKVGSFPTLAALNLFVSALREHIASKHAAPVAIAQVVFGWSESDHLPDEKLNTELTLEEAEALIFHAALFAPDNGAYDKTDFKVTFQDGNSYSGRLDLQQQHRDQQGRVLRNQMQQVMAWYARKSHPLVQDQEATDAQQWLDRYDESGSCLTCDLDDAPEAGPLLLPPVTGWQPPVALLPAPTDARIMNRFILSCFAGLVHTPPVKRIESNEIILLPVQAGALEWSEGFVMLSELRTKIELKVRLYGDHLRRNAPQNVIYGFKIDRRRQPDKVGVDLVVLYHESDPKVVLDIGTCRKVSTSSWRISDFLHLGELKQFVEGLGIGLVDDEDVARMMGIQLVTAADAVPF